MTVESSASSIVSSYTSSSSLSAVSAVTSGTSVSSATSSRGAHAEFAGGLPSKYPNLLLLSPQFCLCAGAILFRIAPTSQTTLAAVDGPRVAPASSSDPKDLSHPSLSSSSITSSHEQLSSSPAQVSGPAAPCATSISAFLSHVARQPTLGVCESTSTLTPDVARSLSPAPSHPSPNTSDRPSKSKSGSWRCDSSEPSVSSEFPVADSFPTAAEDEREMIAKSAVTSTLGPGKSLQVCVIYHQRKHEYLLSKGRRDQFEGALLDTALRETYEETGYPCKPFSVTMTTRAPVPGQDIKDNKIGVSTADCLEPFAVGMRTIAADNVKFYHWFIAEVSADAPLEGTRMPSESSFTSCWFDADEAIERLTYESDRQVTRKAVSLVREELSLRLATIALEREQGRT